jgi:signal peptidase I
MIMRRRKEKPRRKESKAKSASRNVIEVIIAFAVAWLIYQGIAAAAGTGMPIVSVVSHSMYHDNTFDAWWNENKAFYLSYNITKEDFLKFPMNNGLSRGDLLIVVKDDSPKPGDIVIYNRFASFTIVHRIIEVQDSNYIIKGDNNPVADSPVPKEYLVGKAVFAIPMLGYPRLALYAVGI